MISIEMILMCFSIEDWCLDLNKLFSFQMTHHNVGALVVVKPGAKEALAGIITERGLWYWKDSLAHLLDIWRTVLFVTNYYKRGFSVEVAPLFCMLGLSYHPLAHELGELH